MQIEKAKILTNAEVAHNIWEMKFEAPLIAKGLKGAGEFLNILSIERWQNPLRRPMSIASSNGEVLSIIYKIFGEMTTILSNKRTGDYIELLGPLGNTFTHWQNGHHPILVGGGVGLAPILNLQSECKSAKIEHSIIIGARSSNEHFIGHNPDQQIYLTTDDGTAGESGTVMGPLERLVKEKANPYIYACGPEPMLESVRDFSLAQNVPAQLSVESYMGCGVGFCQGCVIPRVSSQIQDHSYHHKYSLVCLDGPVYEAKDIQFA